MTTTELELSALELRTKSDTLWAKARTLEAGQLRNHLLAESERLLDAAWRAEKRAVKSGSWLYRA